MEIFTKLLAFILLLVWAALTITLVVPAVMGMGDSFDDWICAGRCLLEKVLE
jgi:hypothetical protein